jgi:hypothetical protein
MLPAFSAKRCPEHFVARPKPPYLQANRFNSPCKISAWDLLCVLFMIRKIRVSTMSIGALSLTHSSSVAGREIFVSHNSGRMTAYPEINT